MLEVVPTKQFRKEYRRMIRRGKNPAKMEYVLKKLQNEEPLEKKYRDHDLQGDWTGYRECHIEPDWLLIYKVDKGMLILTTSRTGTHSDLFQ